MATTTDMFVHCYFVFSVDQVKPQLFAMIFLLFLQWFSGCGVFSVVVHTGILLRKHTIFLFDEII